MLPMMDLDQVSDKAESGSAPVLARGDTSRLQWPIPPAHPVKPMAS